MDEQHKKWYDDQNNWKFGFFYFNKADDRILVSKHYSFGWTFNFGNPKTYIYVVIILIGLGLILKNKRN
jgi:uncharacterized membrane protein